VLGREPWAHDAAQLIEAVARGRARGFLAGHAVSTIHYIVSREKSAAVAATAVADILDLLDVVPLDSADFRRALAMGLKDYEDALQVAACLKAGATWLATRNARDFRGATVAVRSPGELLALLAVTGG
jgi:predicted nucleic acid-binding protein